MDWEKWSGFRGEGIYVIINLSNLHSLELDAVDHKVTTNPHTPNNPAQLWRIHKWAIGDVYAIENVFLGTIITSPDEVVTGESAVEGGTHERHMDLPDHWSLDILWIIDTGICALEPGKIVVFRSIKKSGYVLSGGIDDYDGRVQLLKEDLGGQQGKTQKWLLQKQSE
ncbi:MAG: hypothetical protein Q9172_005221 [Xanthocarpia lactea]